VRMRHSGVFHEMPELYPSLKTPCFHTTSGGFQCLPYCFIIGFPKCATSDLWERLQLHPEVLPSNSKETRFLTPGEYSNISPNEGWIGNHTSLAWLANSFQAAAASLLPSNVRERAVLLEGTPLTAWWSSQRLDDGLGRQGYDVRGLLSC